MRLIQNGIDIAECVIGPDAVKRDTCEQRRDKKQPFGQVKKR